MPSNGDRWTSFLKDAMFDLAGDLSSIKEFKWFPVLSLSSWHRPVRLSTVAQRVFSIPVRVTAGEWRDASVPDSPSHPVPVSSGWVWLGWHADCTVAQLWVHTYTHTHTQKQNTLLETKHTHAHMIPQSRGLCIPNYSSDMETLQSRKHLPFPLSYMSTLMPFLKRGKERGRERGPI